ncbi:MAG: sensor histidine kinase [Spirochaetota bacterium]
MNRIALCIRNRRDRQYITRWLSDQYEVISVDGDPHESLNFDLCIVDAASLNEHRETLRKHREVQRPVFLPLLLVARGRRAVKHHTHLLTEVDEIIWAPIARAELHARIAALLRIRNLGQLVEQRYISLANHSNALMLVVQNGHIRYANEAATRMFSQLSNDTPMTHLVAHEHRRLFEHYIERIAAQNHEQSQEESFDSQAPIPTHVEVRLNTEEERWAHAGAAPTFEHDDRELLILMLDVTENKIQERRLRESRRRIQSLAGQLVSVEQRERAILADEIHDGVNQSLASLRMHLDLLAKAGEEADIQREVAAMRKILDDAITQTRTLIVDLDPPDIRESELNTTLSSLVDRFRDSHGLDIGFDGDHEVPHVSKNLQHVLYRGTRELLFNILKHAPNASAYVTLRNTDSEIAITVTDDGPGFDPEETMPGSGFGLYSLRERLRPFEGTVDIRSAPGRGTAIELRVAQTTEEEETYEKTRPTG